MTDFTKGRGQGTGAGLEPPNGQQSGSGSGYKSKLDEILAKAGGNNPIAAAQARNLGKPAAPQPTPNNTTPPGLASQPQSQLPGPTPPPMTPPPAGPVPQQPQANPADPTQRLQQILAMAGQTPAQRAQSQAQQAQQNNAAQFQNMVNQYLQALQQNPHKIMMIEAEFPNLSGPDDYFLQCHADITGAIVWAVHGVDIDYQLQNTTFTKHKLHDNFYNAVPDADLKAVFSTAIITSFHVI